MRTIENLADGWTKETRDEKIIIYQSPFPAWTISLFQVSTPQYYALFPWTNMGENYRYGKIRICFGRWRIHAWSKRQPEGAPLKKFRGKP